MKLHNGIVCPVCEEGKLEQIQKDISFPYKGETHLVKNARIYECNECHESFLDDKDENALEKTLTDIRRRRDGLLTSDEIRAIRKYFSMTQVQFAKALGVAEKNFARYEAGTITQSRSMDKLLRVLRDYPQAAESIFDDWPGRGNSEWPGCTVKPSKKLPVGVEMESESACGISDGE